MILGLMKLRKPHYVGVSVAFGDVDHSGKLTASSQPVGSLMKRFSLPSTGGGATVPFWIRARYSSTEASTEARVGSGRAGSSVVCASAVCRLLRPKARRRTFLVKPILARLVNLV